MLHNYKAVDRLGVLHEAFGRATWVLFVKIVLLEAGFEVPGHKGTIVSAGKD